MIQGEKWKVLIGNNLDLLPTLKDNSIDSIVTDPPYELGFMGKKWDSTGIAYNPDLWRECLRVLKPGGHLLSFGGTRTWHRIAVAIEDAGFEVRDSIAWLSNKTFPKSLDISKAIDKAAGAERKVVFTYSAAKQKGSLAWNGLDRTGGKGSGFGETASITAPSTPEAQQWEGWGTALKPVFEPIVVARKPLIGTVAENVLTYGTGGLNIAVTRVNDRWPSNVAMSDDMAHNLEESVYFFVPKATKRDRSEGLEGENFHPTVKPTDLMRYLVKLVTPPNGTVLDPFTGSGSTGKAAILEGFQFIGIEMTEDYIPIIEGRLAHAEATLQEQKDKEREALF